MGLIRCLPYFSDSTGNSLSSSPCCKDCTRKRWLLGTEGLLAAGGICLGTFLALKGESVWVKAACTTGAFCIALAHTVVLHIPIYTPGGWAYMFTGGILSGAGIGWCLTVAFKEQPKSTIVAYMAGAMSICLTNSMMFHEIHSTPGDSRKKSKKSLARRATTTQGGLPSQQIKCCERKKSIQKYSRDTGAKVQSCHNCKENTPCNIKFSVNDKSTVQTKKSDVETCRRSTENVSEPLESHQQMKTQTYSTLSAEINIHKKCDETAFKLKTTPVRESTQRVSVASRFQGMCSTVCTPTDGTAESNASTPAVGTAERHASTPADGTAESNASTPADGTAESNASTPADGTAESNASTPADGTAAVVHTNNYRSLAESKNLSTSDYPDEFAKGEMAIANQSPVCPSESTDECSIDN